MTYTKEQGKQKMGALVERFRTNIDVYKKSVYKEAQVRRKFIDPFFEALGLDVSNKQGYAEQYKEVVHEDAIKVGRSTRAPDYSFRIGGQGKFFVAQIKKQHLGQLSIRTINFEDPEDVAKHDKLVALVDNLLELQKKYHEARLERDKEIYEQQIKVVDVQVDRLVYDLYGMTEVEMKVVEGRVGE